MSDCSHCERLVKVEAVVAGIADDVEKIQERHDDLTKAVLEEIKAVHRRLDTMTADYAAARGALGMARWMWTALTAMAGGLGWLISRLPSSGH